VISSPYRQFEHKMTEESHKQSGRDKEYIVMARKSNIEVMKVEIVVRSQCRSKSVIRTDARTERRVPQCLESSLQRLAGYRSAASLSLDTLEEEEGLQVAKVEQVLGIL
jgi:hypothetical protein